MVCKRCNNECPPGSYKIQDCIDGTNTDLICKPHRTCDYRTMITVKNGTNDSDTICQCIEGYEWPIDKITKEEETNSAYCNPIKGMCHLNPCHENAFCYDNFKQDGKFDNFVCRCDTTKGYVETEKKGVGKDGCLLLPKKHNHLTNKNDLGRFAGIKVKGVDSNQYSIKTHLDSQFHNNIYNTHIHKHTVEETPSPS